MKSPFRTLLSTRPDPLAIFETTANVVENARLVKIQVDAIKRAADKLAQQEVGIPPWNYEYHFFDGSERTVNYLFWLDALNFCFWGRPRWTIQFNGKKLDGYWALAASLKRAAEENPRFLEAEALAQIEPQDLAAVLCGRGEIPLFAERWKNTRELGLVLHHHWKDQAARLVEQAGGDAPALAQMIADNFSSFRDEVIYDGRPVRFYKRAQILVGDLWGAFAGKQWGRFDRIEQLSAFADYKLPQILRAWKILRYAPALAHRVDQKIPLIAGGPDEVEIRAATLWAVEFLRQELAARGLQLWSLQVDWILWHASQERLTDSRPYHRVRTIYY